MLFELLLSIFIIINLDKNNIDIMRENNEYYSII